MSEEQKRMIEINGIKMEVDLRSVKKIEEYRVGDFVKVLIKEYSEYKVHAGMIVAFDEFKKLPTIVVAYLSDKSWESPLNFVYLNAQTKDIEICHHCNLDLGVSRDDIETRFDREIIKKERELSEIKQKKDYFVRMFGKYFEDRGD